MGMTAKAIAYISQLGHGNDLYSSFLFAKGSSSLASRASRLKAATGTRTRGAGTSPGSSCLSLASQCSPHDPVTQWVGHR